MRTKTGYFGKPVNVVAEATTLKLRAWEQEDASFKARKEFLLDNLAKQIDATEQALRLLMPAYQAVQEVAHEHEGRKSTPMQRYMVARNGIHTEAMLATFRAAFNQLGAMAMELDMMEKAGFPKPHKPEK